MTPKFAVVAATAVVVISGCGATQASVIRASAPRVATTGVSAPRPSAPRPSATGPGATRPGATGPGATRPVTPSSSSVSKAPYASPSPSASAADPALVWLGSAGGQEQVTFNDDVSTLAGDLAVENQSPTVANHLAFEADARVVRAEAEKILATPALLPTVNRAAYEQMLQDFIIVANLLQPGPGYGTTAEDWAAWDRALAASNIIVS